LIKHVKFPSLARGRLGHRESSPYLPPTPGTVLSFTPAVEFWSEIIKKKSDYIENAFFAIREITVFTQFTEIIKEFRIITGNPLIVFGC